MALILWLPKYRQLSEICAEFPKFSLLITEWINSLTSVFAINKRKISYYYKLLVYYQLSSVANKLMSFFNFSKDLEKYKEKTGKDEVCLEMAFPKDYPGSPPFIRVVYPRFRQVITHICFYFVSKPVNFSVLSVNMLIIYLVHGPYNNWWLYLRLWPYQVRMESRKRFDSSTCKYTW